MKGIRGRKFLTDRNALAICATRARKILAYTDIGGFFASRSSANMKGVYGRSMIEMLGVLAIIGVLSAGGVWGYNQAMDSHKFNKFVQDTQTMVGSSLSVLPKPHNHTSTHIVWRGTDLIKLGILPDDISKTASGTSVKNPFTGETDWALGLWEINFNSTLSPLSSNLGNASYTNVPATLFAYTLTVPKKVCVKIYNYNWGNIAPLWYFVVNRTTSPSWTDALINLVVSPLSLSEAKTKCPHDLNKLELDFFIHGRQPTWQ